MYAVQSKKNRLYLSVKKYGAHVPLVDATWFVDRDTAECYCDDQTENVVEIKEQQNEHSN